MRRMLAGNKCTMGETSHDDQSHTMEESTPSKKTFLVHIRQIWDSVRMTLFVLGTALVIFVAARNSITWHMQSFWGASGDYWQSTWENIYDLFGGDEMTLALWGTTAVTFLAFWLYNAFFLLLDVTGQPKALLKYKIQEDQTVDPAKLKKCVMWVLFNQLVVGIPFSYVCVRIMKIRGCDFGRGGLPTFQWALLELVVFALVEELFFYYSHRLFHHPRLYKHVHKKHHEWTAPVGVTAVYAHPLEHMISNMLPPIMGPIVMGSHLATAWLWFGLALLSTTIAHSGYHLPGLPSPEAHDFHHLKFTNNFGVLGVLDRLHGTDKMFRATMAYQRHFLLLGVTPVSQQYPDDPKSPKLQRHKAE